ncbi:MAG: SDR family oxidoreductase [Chloroflexi bacterium]|nr:SDR family oxidoreductase [Ktedonobacteraceae bacterium]MBV8822429.1 SDR family oxidoreductase [Ktedonobacteraceae bacterium]MBV9020713.1 SDR family oxidoreductase [Ktedonobacteraceae bacterium]MBV9707783.1 SDR family oxidoreductase [Chloroflexota bacterium]
MNERKTAIVTGASSGIGFALTKALLDQNYQVVANSRTITKTGTLTPSDSLVLVEGDIGDQQTAKEVVETAIHTFGGIDLLINNAGIFLAKPFTEYSVEDFERLIKTNVTGFFFATQYAIAQMSKQKSGHIVTISTALASQPVAGVPAALPILTKGGLHAVTKALAIEYANDGIRVNTVAAGVIDTPMHKPNEHPFLKQLHPIQRLGNTFEIVDAVMYLNSATFVTGEILHVDGGAHAGKW